MTHRPNVAQTGPDSTNLGEGFSNVPKCTHPNADQGDFEQRRGQNLHGLGVVVYFSEFSSTQVMGASEHGIDQYGLAPVSSFFLFDQLRYQVFRVGC
jgi:hypothetical protein